MRFGDLSWYRGLPTPAVISFSGGRTSAYQLWHVVEANGGLPDDVVVCFQNTGAELPATLDFVQRVGEHLAVPIVWLEYDREAAHWVRVVDRETASTAGEPFARLFSRQARRRRTGELGPMALPNPNQRRCTEELKFATMRRYLRHCLGWPRLFYNVVGFRRDEERRVARRYGRDMAGGWDKAGLGVFPMYEAGADVDDVAAFWASAPFDLGIDSGAGNCTLCFMKSVWNIKRLMQAHPEQVQMWVDLERVERPVNPRFRLGRPSYEEMWEQVRAGDMSATNDQLVCGSCTD